MNDIRLLKASEIECRVQSVKKTNKGVGCVLLLYKDARVDMKLLDEIYGSMNWQRSHELINGNLFCTIEIWDENKKCWVKKQDVGTESNTEKEKGQASDSFKRAGFNVGIGRELYTSPFIYINLNEGEYIEPKPNETNKKIQASPFLKFSVKSIAYNDEREMIALEIIDNKKVVRYKMGQIIDVSGSSNSINNKLDSEQIETIKALATKKGITEKYICGVKKVNSFGELTIQQYNDAVKWLNSKEDKK